MYDKWSLDVFYSGVDDPKLEKDLELLESLNGKYKKAVASADTSSPAQSIRRIIELKEEITNVTNRLFVYFRLRRSADSGDKEGNPYRSRIQKLMSECTVDDVRFKSFVGKVTDLDAVIKGDDLLSEYEFYLNNIKSSLKHTLGEEGEDVFAKMNSSGGQGWSEQYSYLMSHTEADWMGEKKTMSSLQALSKSSVGEERRAAYEAQLATYPKIKDALAFSLNNIKAQVITEAEMRGFSSPLEMTLDQYRLKKETLNAMWDAVKESFPKFRQYLKRKAKLLGYEKGLPWYEIYAPVGTANAKKYTPEDAHKYLVEHFSAFSSEMSQMIDRAFKEEWIDFLPRAGKSGGAFCYGLTWFGEARILTNFNGNFGALNTLAHELGHAFHAMQTKNNRPLNRVNTLPVSETASNFNELFLMNDAINNAEGNDRIVLIDKFITDSLMILPDMYTRYKSEDILFELRKERFVYSDEMEKIMTDLQKEVYGDAIDNDLLYPYVWCDKSHYYSPGRSYYNFPYAFGGLLARGLYAKYCEDGEAFIPKYKELLRTTPIKTVEDAALVADIDLTDPEFWKLGLQNIYDLIDTFIEETN